MKVMTQDMQERMAVLGLLDRTLKGLKLHDKNVVVVPTIEGVEMTAADIQMLAAKVVPYVLQALGIKAPPGMEID